MKTATTAADCVIIGAGVAGMAAATRLQARGLQTLVLEAHGQVGGCAGFYRHKGFAFDVGATTLVDFEPGGVGGRWLAEIGLERVLGEALPGYCAWLPDRDVKLHRDPARWHAERLRAFGATPAHLRFWKLLDELADIFWEASRDGVKLPLITPMDVFRAARSLPTRRWPLLRYLTWTMADALAHCGLQDDIPLRALLGMLLQDTVHAPLDTAPLINGALGVTIRGAGLTRAHGGMRGFWQMIVARYRALGGVLRVGTRVQRVTRTDEGFTVHTQRGDVFARQVISTLPIWNTARLGLSEITTALQPYMQRDEPALGGALVVFLGVPEEEVTNQPETHHQILQDYSRPLGDGNNMFISVSAPGDEESAPRAHRAVMLSTHCEIAPWENLSEPDYAARKSWALENLLQAARRVYPNLGAQARICELGTPRTYEQYTHRYRGAVGGVRQTMHNSNQHAVPYSLGVPGFWQAGDTTWPGLGTVACVSGSRHIADGVWAYARRKLRWEPASSIVPGETR